MNPPQKSPGMSVAGRRRRAVLGGLVLVAVIVGTYRLAQPRAPRTEPSRPLSELVRVDGRLVLRDATNVLFTGWITDQYPDGTLKSRSQVVEGRLQGVSEGWYTNGQIQIREQFVRGVSDGPRVKWHANGTTQSQAVVVQGELEGPFYRWHEQGTLAEAVNLKRGRPDGVSHAFYPSGFLKARVRLEDGKVVEQQFWKDGEQAGSDRTVAAAAPDAVERRN